MRASLLLFWRRDLASFLEEIELESLGLPDAFHLERDGINRLLEIVESRGGLPGSWQFLLVCARHEPPHQQSPGNEKHNVAGGMEHLTHRRSGRGPGEVDDVEDRHADQPL